MTLNKVITVESSDGAEATTIDAAFGGAGVNITVGATLRGFTVTHGGGSGPGGSGIVVGSGGALIDSNRIIENQACGEGGGIPAAGPST